MSVTITDYSPSCVERTTVLTEKDAAVLDLIREAVRVWADTVIAIRFGRVAAAV